MCDIDPKDVRDWTTTSSSITGGGGTHPGNNNNQSGGSGSGSNNSGNGGTIDLDPIVGIGPVNVDEETEKE